MKMKMMVSRNTSRRPPRSLSNRDRLPVMIRRKDLQSETGPGMQISLPDPDCRCSIRIPIQSAKLPSGTRSGMEKFPPDPHPDCNAFLRIPIWTADVYSESQSGEQIFHRIATLTSELSSGSKSGVQNFTPDLDPDCGSFLRLPIGTANLFWIPNRTESFLRIPIRPRSFPRPHSVTLADL